MSETVNYKQMSIYDFIGEENNFLPEEKSQEVQPSETAPQVDEAQETVELYADGKLIATSTVPSSALDTKIPTEDTDNVGSESSTDKTLFSVGDVLTVRQASNVYNADEQPEDFYFIKEYEGEQVKVLNIRGDSLLCNTFNLDRNIWLRSHELIKI